MKTNKITVTVTIEVLSTDCVPHLIALAQDNYVKELHNGTLIADDGDTVSWETKSKPVTI